MQAGSQVFNRERIGHLAGRAEKHVLCTDVWHIGSQSSYQFTVKIIPNSIANPTTRYSPCILVALSNQRNHIRRRKQALGAHIHPVEPLAVDILYLPDLPPLGEHQLVLRPFSRVPCPPRDSSASTAPIRRELVRPARPNANIRLGTSSDISRNQPLFSPPLLHPVTHLQSRRILLEPQRLPTDPVSHRLPSQNTVLALHKRHDRHPMAGQTPPPPLHPILQTNPPLALKPRITPLTNLPLTRPALTPKPRRTSIAM
jgi:hypothetical protein